MTEETSDQAGGELDTENTAAVADDAPVGDQTNLTDQDGNPLGDDASLLDDEHEEIERGGKKYKVPKALVPELLMQSDYTRKTQEVAETRKELDAQRAEIAQQAELAKANIREHAKVAAIEDQVEAYKKVDWATLRASDRDQYDEHWDRYQMLKDNLGTAQAELSKKDEAALAEQHASRAKLIQEAVAVLQKDIPEWSPEYAGKLTDFGEKELGLSRAEAAQITDPRVIKALHLAYKGAQLEQTQRKTANLEKAQKVTPAATVTGGKGSPPVGLDDRLSADEWMKRRNAQLAKR